jgi:hypothetical protein
MTNARPNITASEAGRKPVLAIEQRKSLSTSSKFFLAGN